MPEPNCSSLAAGGEKRSRIRRSIFPKVCSHMLSFKLQELTMANAKSKKPARTGSGATLPCFPSILGSIWRAALSCTQVNTFPLDNKIFTLKSFTGMKNGNSRPRSCLWWETQLPMLDSRSQRWQPKLTLKMVLSRPRVVGALRHVLLHQHQHNYQQHLHQHQHSPQIKAKRAPVGANKTLKRFL